jgi:hypothetical protein
VGWWHRLGEDREHVAPVERKWSCRLQMDY